MLVGDLIYLPMHGIGSVISHLLADGSEKPIAFASRILSSSENYCHLEKD